MSAALWTLAPAGLVAGALCLWAFRRLADGAAIGQTINRVQAHLLEFWLFVDEPAEVWKSWRGLLVANGRFLRLLLVPLVVLSIPSTPLLFLLDACYGVAPLPVNQAALVTLKLNRPLEAPELTAPEGISIEGPPVRAFSQNEVSWRIRPRRAMSGTLEWIVAGNKVDKSIAAGESAGPILWKRTWFLPGAGPIDWIEVAYPSARVALLGLEAHWSVWFFGFSLLGVLLVKMKR
jgi:hypothetical protein